MNQKLTMQTLDSSSRDSEPNKKKFKVIKKAKRSEASTIEAKNAAKALANVKALGVHKVIKLNHF